MKSGPTVSVRRSLLLALLVIAAATGAARADTKRSAPERTERFDDKVQTLRLLADGRMLVVTNTEIVELARDGKRRRFIPAGCGSLDGAAFSADGTWVALTCTMTADAGIWRMHEPRRALAVTGAGEGMFCGDWFYSFRDERKRYKVGTWQAEPIEATGSHACVANRVLLTEGGTQLSSGPKVTNKGSNRLLGPFIGRDAVVTYGYPESLGIVDLKGNITTGPKLTASPEAAARVGDTWIIVADRKLEILPGGPKLPADGFAITHDGSAIWIWRDKQVQQVSWTRPPPPPPKKPVASILFGKPTRYLDGDDDDFVAVFEQPTMRAYVRFSPSGDDLYAYVLVVSDTRGGTERIDSETCERTATKYKDLVGAGITVTPSACARPGRAVITSSRRSAAHRPDWLHFVSAKIEGKKVVLAEMEGYGEGTELWMWRWSDAKGDYDAASWGAPPILGLPGEP